MHSIKDFVFVIKEQGESEEKPSKAKAHEKSKGLESTRTYLVGEDTTV